MTHGVQSLAVKQHTIFKNIQVLLLVELTFIGDTNQVNGADAAGTHAQSGAADRIDKGIQLLGVAE